LFVRVGGPCHVRLAGKPLLLKVRRWEESEPRLFLSAR
jgi:hypothetical protein